MQPTRHYLVLDQSDPIDPRWVIVRAVLNRRALVPPNLDGPGARWLDGFRGPHFDWLAEILGPIGVRAPQHGKEGYATRLVTDQMIPYEFDRWGHGMGWYAGWSDDPAEWADPAEPAADDQPEDKVREPDDRHDREACPTCERPYDVPDDEPSIDDPYRRRHPD